LLSSLFSLGSALLFLPLPVQLTNNPPIFALDLPVWSLFFELFVNLLLVVFYRYITNRTVRAIVALSGISLIGVAEVHGNLHVGWDTDNFFYGFPRSLFSFFAGVLIHRHFPRGLRSGGPFVTCMIAMVLVMPTPANIHGIYDPALAVLLFPIGIAAIAGWKLRGVKARAAQALGELSYPLYVIHMPCIYILQNWSKGWDRYERLVAFSLTIFTLVIVSLTAKFVETPIRRWLSEVSLGRNEGFLRG
jgi:peptidoglycan/LPS O-acetylase OafA/YrhL